MTRHGRDFVPQVHSVMSRFESGSEPVPAKIESLTPGRLNLLLWSGILVVLTCIAYIPAMRAGFIWDDDNYVTQNRMLRSTAGLWSIWTDPRSTPQYYPLVHTTYWCEFQAWGLWPPGYHLVNILLHASNAVLIWLILRKLEVPAPWMAAAVFALHPVHVESVAWITERKNVLSGFFSLAATIAFLQFAESSYDRRSCNSQRWGYYVLTLVLFVAALLSKTVAVTLPAALLLITCWRKGRISVENLLHLLPMFGIAVPFALLTIWLERYHVGATGADWQLTLIERGLIAGRAFWFYAGKLIWPHPLIFIYPRWQISGSMWWQHLYPLSAVGVIILLAVRRKQIGSGPLVAVLLFAGILFPALGFFNTFPMRYSFVADHFQYIASNH